MQKAIRKVFQNKTIIAIAHRLDTVIDFDRIAVLEGGNLIECDKPEVLLSRQSAFKAMYEVFKSEVAEN